MNDSNKTGFLKLKYKNMNQTEIPQMNFVNKKEKLNINKSDDNIEAFIKQNNLDEDKNNQIIQEFFKKT